MINSQIQSGVNNSNRDSVFFNYEDDSRLSMNKTLDMKKALIAVKITIGEKKQILN
jgi:hypothetical protein